MMMNRRQTLRLAAGTLLYGKLMPMARLFPTLSASIKNAVANSEMLVGVTIGGTQISDSVQSKFILDNFNMVTPGTAMKWAAIHPEPNNFSWGYSDSIVTFARQHSLAVHGHNLCWNKFNPDWVQKTVNRSNARSILENHVRTVASRYRGQIDTWDVVNEPIRMGHGTPQNYMPGPWFDNLGAEYLDITFHATADTDPKAIRQLNIDKVEQDSEECEATRQAELALIRSALKRGVPIQAVGIESHIVTNLPVRSEAFVRFLRELMDMGLSISITELDVDDGGVHTDVPNRLQVVSDYYQQYLELVIPLTGTRRVNFWSLSDKNNWLDVTFPRKDHQHHHPGLMSDNFTPNPAYSGIQAALGKIVHR